MSILDLILVKTTPCDQLEGATATELAIEAGVPSIICQAIAERGRVGKEKYNTELRGPWPAGTVEALQELFDATAYLLVSGKEEDRIDAIVIAGIAERIIRRLSLCRVGYNR